MPGTAASLQVPMVRRTAHNRETGGSIPSTIETGEEMTRELPRHLTTIRHVKVQGIGLAAKPSRGGFAPASISAPSRK